MIVLTINVGSSSIKAALFDQQRKLWEEGEKLSTKVEVESAVRRLILKLWAGENALVDSAEDIKLVGHRIVHGGMKLTESKEITGEVHKLIEEAVVLAPLHNPLNLAGVNAAKKLLPMAKHIAVFDTAFHKTIPAKAYLYGGPSDWADFGLRRFGFHGISVQYASRRAAELIGKVQSEISLLVCHLGNGCSMTAVERGNSVDTTMGMTPLEGPLMGTRSGTIDPGIIFHLLREGTSAEKLEDLLNHESGLKGLSGISGDLRILMGNKEKPAVKVALDVFVHQLRRHLAALIPSLSKLDSIVFTGGIGENQAEIREQVCTNFFGVELDPKLNLGSGDRLISTGDSSAKVFVIRANEALEIARECENIVG